MTANDNGDKLAAQYRSPNGNKDFSSPLLPATSSNSSTEDKTAYLSDLRSKLRKLQGDVNVFLTGKMEQGKAAQGAGTAGQPPGVDEDKEEEMYGEEDPEKDG